MTGGRHEVGWRRDCAGQDFLRCHLEIWACLLRGAGMLRRSRFAGSQTGQRQGWFRSPGGWTKTGSSEERRGPCRGAKGHEWWRQTEFWESVSAFPGRRRQDFALSWINERAHALGHHCSPGEPAAPHQSWRNQRHGCRESVAERLGGATLPYDLGVAGWRCDLAESLGGVGWRSGRAERERSTASDPRTGRLGSGFAGRWRLAVSAWRT